MCYLAFARAFTVRALRQEGAGLNQVPFISVDYAIHYFNYAFCFSVPTFSSPESRLDVLYTGSVDRVLAVRTELPRRTLYFESVFTLEVWGSPEPLRVSSQARIGFSWGEGGVMLWVGGW
jgi:hypothetical protein